ncbi:14 kDa proline-rich protein DC2.15 [Dendrobium catenatum]|uniref:14 kDa proline-rich protein DC2.15 n=1 Tax=Dendrobium catenatum TaxID=906689 RepID=A0A2I0VK27_9ASPA|nr:14 kDa proline-rich protein DC2.15 [Dendrobium catenatum]
MASLNAYPSLLILSLLLFLALDVSSTHLTCPPSPHKPSPKPSPKPHKSSCPRDTVKLGACSDLLGGLLDVTVGQPPKEPCCSLLEGLDHRRRSRRLPLHGG